MKLGNKGTTSGRRGTILLQTTVMAVILATIAVMTLKWTLGRYAVVSNVKRSTEAKGIVEACASQDFSKWGGDIPPAIPDCANITPEQTRPVTIVKSPTTTGLYSYKIKFDINY